MNIELYSAPAMVTWQLTRDCNLACVHCCTDSAPGRALPGELSRGQALQLAAQIVDAKVPYVMLVGGEPTIVPHFYELAEFFGRAGVYLKIETNGQRLNRQQAERLSALPIRSIQISIDGATQKTYGRMRPGGSLEAALSACRMVRDFKMPLEITFAPTQANYHEAQAVIDLALQLGAFRFNTGRLMRLGTAAKLWGRLELPEEAYAAFYRRLQINEEEYAGHLEFCFRPFALSDQVSESMSSPAAALLVLPDGKVKVSAALPYFCADLKKVSFLQAWEAYCQAWNHPLIARRLHSASQDSATLAKANDWMPLEHDLPALMV